MLQRSKVKYIQRLSHKKFRDETGEFVVEGPKPVSELIRERPGSVKTVFGTSEWMEANTHLLGRLPSEMKVTVDSSELEGMSSLETPNRVLAVASMFGPPAVITDPKGPILALEDIRDPGNLGTIIRTADWFGISDVVCSRSTVDFYNPKVVQATMGSLFRVRLHEADLATWLGGLSRTTVLCATLDGRSVYGMAPLRSGVLVIGNESHGISDTVSALCTERVTVPRMGRAESLNASVATGILLSHLVAGA